MSAEFQNPWIILLYASKYYCFLDDILIVSECTEEDYFKLVTECLTKLDADNLLIILTKFLLATPAIS